jgi:hypothetical protein
METKMSTFKGFSPSSQEVSIAVGSREAWANRDHIERETRFESPKPRLSREADPDNTPKFGDDRMGRFKAMDGKTYLTPDHPCWGMLAPYAQAAILVRMGQPIIPQ